MQQAYLQLYFLLFLMICLLLGSNYLHRWRIILTFKIRQLFETYQCKFSTSEFPPSLAKIATALHPKLIVEDCLLQYPSIK